MKPYDRFVENIRSFCWKYTIIQPGSYTLLLMMVYFTTQSTLTTIWIWPLSSFGVYLNPNLELTPALIWNRPYWVVTLNGNLPQFQYKVRIFSAYSFKIQRSYTLVDRILSVERSYTSPEMTVYFLQNYRILLAMIVYSTFDPVFLITKDWGLEWNRKIWLEV